VCLQLRYAYTEGYFFPQTADGPMTVTVDEAAGASTGVYCGNVTLLNPRAWSASAAADPNRAFQVGLHMTFSTQHTVVGVWASDK
jgi:hypothetical protein